MKASFFYVLFLFTIFSTIAQVGIGTTNPNASSMLEVSATDKGILIPQVALGNVTDTMLDGVNTAATGLLIYNTNAGTTGGNGIGYYYFNGSTWERLTTSTTSEDDIDWYEEGTTTSPNAIADDMFTQGNVAIGKTTADYALDIEENTEDRGINVLLSGTDNNVKYGQYIENANTGIGMHYGSYNTLSGIGTGWRYGTYNNILDTDGGGHYGSYNKLRGNASLMYGAYNDLSATGSGFLYGTTNNITSPGSGDHYGVKNNVFGVGDGDHYGSSNFLSGSGDGGWIGTYNELFGTGGSGEHTGTSNIISNSGTGTHYGTKTILTGDVKQYGTYNDLSGVGIHYGTFQKITSSSSLAQYGTRNELYGNSGTTYGFYSLLDQNTHEDMYGFYSTLNGGGDSSRYGSYQIITDTGNPSVGDFYGSYNHVSGTGSTGLKYGVYNKILTTAGGTHYGVYSDVLKAGSYAGYFLGNVSVGTTTANNYLLPASRGTNTQVMQTDGSGNLSWVNTSSIGDDLGSHGATTTLDLNTNEITEVNKLSTLATSDYDKLRVYNSANYTIGMHSAMSFGYLNDYAMTFTMNNDADRGWLWRDVADAQTDGSMSLTTNGDLAIKSNLLVDTNTFYVNATLNRVGIGTTSPLTSLHINHPTGATNGLTISNSSDADRWHFYTYSTNNLYMYFNGVAKGQFSAVSGAYSTISDRRLKKNINKIPSVLDKVGKLDVVSYNFIDQKGTEKYVGLIAQDVEKVFPHLVSKPEHTGIHGEEGVYTLDYSGFGILAIKAIQEQQKEIDQLKQEIAEIKAMLKKL